MSIDVKSCCVAGYNGQIVKNLLGKWMQWTDRLVLLGDRIQWAGGLKCFGQSGTMDRQVKNWLGKWIQKERLLQSCRVP